LSFDIVVQGNNVERNYLEAIYSKESGSVLIEQNTLANNAAPPPASDGDGINIDSPEGSHLVKQNIISANKRDGIIVQWSSRLIKHYIYHNSFINNGRNALSYLASSTWDDGYPSGGNYWSDYEERYPNATELDDSGIWDTPYVIDEQNQDRYPLMKPYAPLPGDFDDDRDIDEEDIWYFCSAFIDYYTIHVKDPICDFDNDCDIDEYDLWYFCAVFICYKYHVKA